MTTIYTTREMAELLGTDEWRIRRLFEDGDLPEPKRFAGKRTIKATDIVRLIDALRARGWLVMEHDPNEPDQAADRDENR